MVNIVPHDITKEYYVCSFDGLYALRQLPNKEFVFVCVILFPICVVDNGLPSYTTCHRLEYVAPIDIETARNPHILIKELTNEELTYLTLSCNSVKLYNSRGCSYTLNHALHHNTNWLKT